MKKGSCEVGSLGQWQSYSMATLQWEKQGNYLMLFVGCGWDNSRIQGLCQHFQQYLGNKIQP